MRLIQCILITEAYTDQLVERTSAQFALVVAERDIIRKKESSDAVPNLFALERSLEGE